MRKGYSCIGLSNPKDIKNIGKIVRLCGNFNVSLLAIQGNRYKKVCTDTMKYSKFFPILNNINLHDIIPYDCIPIAVDIVQDAKCIYDFDHPERSFYIFGPEDGTLGKNILSWCKEKIYIPSYQCMNLAMAVGIVLYDRSKKRNEFFNKK